jgi:thiol-disulfide isomerase/thioredoxin
LTGKELGGSFLAMKKRKPQTMPPGPSPLRLGLFAALAVLAAGAGVMTSRYLSGNEGGYSRAEPELQGKLVRRATPQAMPDLTFAAADGTPHRLSEWRGKVVVLNLWATWCGPCKAEMPALDRLQAKLGSDAFAVLTISQDRTGPEKPAAFLAANGIAHLPLYIDAKAEATQALRASGLPTSLILDREGREVARLLGGADWDSPDMAAKIEGFIKEGSAG